MFSGEILAMICACTAEPTINDEMFQLTGAISFLNYLSIGRISVGYGIFGDIKWYFWYKNSSKFHLPNADSSEQVFTLSIYI